MKADEPIMSNYFCMFNITIPGNTQTAVVLDRLNGYKSLEKISIRLYRQIDINGTLQEQLV